MVVVLVSSKLKEAGRLFGFLDSWVLGSVTCLHCYVLISDVCRVCLGGKIISVLSVLSCFPPAWTFWDVARNRT